MAAAKAAFTQAQPGLVLATANAALLLAADLAQPRHGD